MFLELPTPRGPFLEAILLLLFAVLWLRYIASRDSFKAHRKRDNVQAPPLTFPYIFPLLGSLPITYLLRPRDFVLDQQ
jgi:hypothetical protein